MEDDRPLRLSRKTLPLDLTLILTLARAIESRASHQIGAPAQLSLIHGWAGPVMSQVQKLLNHPKMRRAFLRGRPKILLREAGPWRAPQSVGRSLKRD